MPPPLYEALTEVFLPPQILELPSKLFYKNKLTCKAVFPMTGPKDIPANKFIGVDGREMQEEDSPSYYNHHESIMIAEQVYLCCVVDLVSRTCGSSEEGWLWGTCTVYIHTYV